MSVNEQPISGNGSNGNGGTDTKRIRKDGNDGISDFLFSCAVYKFSHLLTYLLTYSQVYVICLISLLFTPIKLVAIIIKERKKKLTLILAVFNVFTNSSLHCRQRVYNCSYFLHLSLKWRVCVAKVHGESPTYIEGFRVHYRPLRDVTARRRDVTMTSSVPGGVAETRFTLAHLDKYTW